MVDITDQVAQLAGKVRTTSTDQVVLRGEKNAVEVAAAQLEVENLKQRDKLAEEATAFQALISTQNAELQVAAANKVADIYGRTQQEIEISTRAREQTERVYEEKLAKHAELTENANYSFFRNPLTYIRDQYRIDNATKSANDTAQNLSAVNNHIDNQFMQAAYEIDSYHKQVTSVTQATNNLASQETAASLAAKNAKLAVAEASRNKVLDTSRARTDVSAYEAQSSDAKNAASLKYLYGLQNNFDYTYWGDQAKINTQRFYESMTQQQKYVAELGAARWWPHDQAGTGITYQEHLADLAQRNDVDSWMLASAIAGDQTGASVGDLGRSAIIQDVYKTQRAQFLEEFEKEDPTAFAAARGQLTSAQEKLVKDRAQLAVGTMDGQQVLIKSVDIVKADSETAAKHDRTFLTSRGAGDILRTEGASAEVAAWLDSEKAHAALDVPNMQYGDPVAGGLYAAYTGMIRDNLREADVVQGLAILAREMAHAKYVSTGEHGKESEFLQKLGYGTRVKPRVMSTIKKDALTKGVKTPTFLNVPIVDVGKLMDAGNVLGAADAITREEIDFTNAADLQNFFVRMDAYHGAIAKAAAAEKNK